MGPNRNTVRLLLSVAAVLLALIAASSVAQQDTTVFDDWAMACNEAGICVLQQRVFLEGNDETPLVQVMIQMSGEPPQPTLTIRVPLGLLLGGGLQLSIDGSNALMFPFHHCRAEGCLAIAALSEGLTRRLKRGLKAQLAFQLLDGRRLEVPISLLGITAGMNALTKTIANPKRE